jgi:hypothetical protein
MNDEDLTYTEMLKNALALVVQAMHVAVDRNYSDDLSGLGYVRNSLNKIILSEEDEPF